jgi:hypothetical protein
VSAGLGRLGLSGSSPAERIDFVLSLPLSHFVSDGLRRRPFREAMRSVLPETVRTWSSEHVAIADLEVKQARTRGTALAHLAAAERNPAATAGRSSAP